MKFQPKKRVLVCGGREFTDWEYFRQTMEDILPWLDKDVIFISGGARGADTMIINWCTARGLPCAVVRANWEYYRREAGSRRNSWMLLLEPDLVVAFPGGAGTANMIKQSKSRGIDVYEK